MCMKSILLLFLVNVYQVIAYDANNFMQDLNGISTAITSQISFLLCVGPTAGDYVKFPLTSGNEILDHPSYDKSKETVFFLHGWSERPSDPFPNNFSNSILADAFLRASVANFIVVNYENLVQHDINVSSWSPDPMNMGAAYLSSVKNGTYIGSALGYFFKYFIGLCQCQDKLRLIGFSLGAQIMANMTVVFGDGQINRITCLDAAGPIYSLLGYNHIKKYPGVFIDAFHTDGGIFGYPFSYANVDFYLNSGVSLQPPCLKSNIRTCSHYTSVKYYAESIGNPSAFQGVSCTSALSWSSSLCSKNAVATMGYWIDINTPNGNYYAKTSSSSFYGLGTSGISKS